MPHCECDGERNRTHPKVITTQCGAKRASEVEADGSECRIQRESPPCWLERGGTDGRHNNPDCRPHDREDREREHEQTDAIWQHGLGLVSALFRPQLQYVETLCRKLFPIAPDAGALTAAGTAAPRPDGRQ